MADLPLADNRGEELRVSGAARLCHGETALFEVVIAGRTREAFVLCYEGQFLAFLNQCPHWSVELDLGDGHFFDEAMDRVYCKNHGAIFHPTTGACESGPCLGRALDRFLTRVEGDDVIVDLTLIPSS